jgi:hypothetical protein
MAGSGAFTAALAGGRAFAAGAAGRAAAGFASALAAGGFGLFAAAGFVAAGLTRFFATASPESPLPDGLLSARATDGRLRPEGEVTVLRALAADAFIANLVASEPSMNEHALVNGTRNTNRRTRTGRCPGAAELSV